MLPLYDEGTLSEMTNDDYNLFTPSITSNIPSIRHPTPFLVTLAK